MNNIELTFKFFDINGENMSLTAICGEQRCEVTPENNVARLTAEFPTVITLVLSGKDMSSDTVVGEDGSIVADKHIELTQLAIDKFVINPEILKTIPVVKTADSEIRSSYFGFNGEATLPFEGKTALHWLIKNN